MAVGAAVSCWHSLSSVSLALYQLSGLFSRLHHLHIRLSVCFSSYQWFLFCSWSFSSACPSGSVTCLPWECNLLSFTDWTKTLHLEFRVPSCVCHPEFTRNLGLAIVLLVASISLSKGGVAINVSCYPALFQTRPALTGAGFCAGGFRYEFARAVSGPSSHRFAFPCTISSSCTFIMYTFVIFSVNGVRLVTWDHLHWNKQLFVELWLFYSFTLNKAVASQVIYQLFLVLTL